MMKIYLCFISFILCYYLSVRKQPYFPLQIVFSPGDDEINQRAYVTYPLTPSLTQVAYVMKHFPFAFPDSPQSKYYVQLSNLSSAHSCIYGTYWKYGGDIFNFFPSHWINKKSFEIKNYMNYKYEILIIVFHF